MFSLTVMSLNRLWFCVTWTTPIFRICRGDLPLSFSPCSVTVPRRGLSRPLITRITVDLPAPFGPTTQVMDPSGTSKLTPRSTSPPP